MEGSESALPMTPADIWIGLPPNSGALCCLPNTLQATSLAGLSLCEKYPLLMGFGGENLIRLDVNTGVGLAHDTSYNIFLNVSIE